MAMGAHIERHAVEIEREVGAVIEVEAAQEILVGFAVAAVLRDDKTWHDFQRLAGLLEGQRVHLLAGEEFLA